MFGGLVQRVTGWKPKRKLDDCHALKIDSELLSCPVCYNLLTSVPRVLPCGHTLCCDCLTQLTATTSRDTRSVLACPICRTTVRKSARFPKNYQLNALLETIDEWANSQIMNDHSTSNAQRIAMKRTAARLELAQNENVQLKRELEALRVTQQRYTYLIGGLSCVSIPVALRLLLKAVLSVFGINVQSM